MRPMWGRLGAGLALPTISLAVLVQVALIPHLLAAQDVTFSGQIRPRYEYLDPVPGATTRSFTSMRTRFALEAQLERGISVFIQPQDVRIWGEEDHPLRDFSAEGFDMHQAYVRIRPESLPWLAATAGRMEAPLGGHRLVGTVDWLPQGQAFDGVGVDVEAGSSSWRGLAYVTRDAAAPSVDEDRGLYGAYGTLGEIGPGALDVYWLYDRLRGDELTNEHFLGARYVFDLDGRITGRAETTLASGTRQDVEVGAFLFGARVGTTFADGRLSVVAWYDYLSGDDPDTPEVEVFHTLYATNHKFYGLADLFTNIPLHTGGAGLQDLALKLRWQASPTTSAAADLHTFRAAAGTGLVDAHFGEELDLSVAHRYSSDLVATTGLSYVWQADGFAEIGRLTENQTFFYVMVDVRF
jgi:hypothetical protein